MALETVPLRQLQLQLAPTLTYLDELDVIESNVRLYNDTGQDRVISYVRATLAVPSEGTLPVIVDILQNGDSIFDNTTPPIGGGGGIRHHKIYLDAGEYEALAYPVDPTVWNAEDYLTISILQVGETYAGQDLTINLGIGE